MNIIQDFLETFLTGLTELEDVNHSRVNKHFKKFTTVLSDLNEHLKKEFSTDSIRKFSRKQSKVSAIESREGQGYISAKTKTFLHQILNDCKTLGQLCLKSNHDLGSKIFAFITISCEAVIKSTFCNRQVFLIKKLNEPVAPHVFSMANS